MARTSFADIVGNLNLLTFAVASLASNASATVPIVRVPYDAKVIGAHLVFTTSRASSTKVDSLTLVNLGTDGTGTVVLGTHKASAPYASYTPLSLTLATNPTIAGGNTIGLVFTTNASATTVEAAQLALHLRFI